MARLVWSFPITPKLKAQAEQGMPLYSKPSGFEFVNSGAMGEMFPEVAADLPQRAEDFNDYQKSVATAARNLVVGDDGLDKVGGYLEELNRGLAMPEAQDYTYGKRALPFSGAKDWLTKKTTFLDTIRPLAEGTTRVIDAFGGSGIYGQDVQQALGVKQRLLNEGWNSWLLKFHRDASNNKAKLVKDIKELRKELEGLPVEAIADRLWKEIENGNSAAYVLAQSAQFSNNVVSPKGAERNKKNLIRILNSGEGRAKRFWSDTPQSMLKNYVPARVSGLDGWELAASAKADDLVLLDPDYVRSPGRAGGSSNRLGTALNVEEFLSKVDTLAPAIERGAKFVLNNYPNPQLVQGLTERGWTVFEAKKEWGKTNELIATNPAVEAPAVLESRPGMFTKDFWWTDPSELGQSVESLTTQGWLQRRQADYIDYFAPLELKGESGRATYDYFDLARSKKSSKMSNAEQFYANPLRDFLVAKGWTTEKADDWVTARHIVEDQVNKVMTEDNSRRFAMELEKAFYSAYKAATNKVSKQKWHKLYKAMNTGRLNIQKGFQADGSNIQKQVGGAVVNIDPATVKEREQKELMVKLVNDHIAEDPGVFVPEEATKQQELRFNWEGLKKHGSGMTNEEAQALYDEAKQQDGHQELFDRYDAINKAILEELENGRIISAAERTRMSQLYKHFAPLRREKYDFEHTIDELISKTSPGRQVKTRGGSVEKLKPVHAIENSLARLDAAIAAGQRNLANNFLYEQIQADYKNWEDWFHRPAEKVPFLTRDKNGFLIEREAGSIDRTHVHLIRNGKRLYIAPKEENERALQIVRAINNLDAKNLDGPMAAFQHVNNYIRWVNISASIPFLFANSIRDPLTAAYNLKSYEEADKYVGKIFGEYKNSLKALKKVYWDPDGRADKNDPLVQAVLAWEKAGGRISFVESFKEMDTSFKSFEAQVKRRQIKGAGWAITTGKNFLDGVEKMNIIAENIMRLSTFTVLTRPQSEGGAGLTTERAARISKDITTNFTRRGFKTQTLGVWWLFFNASVQGNYQVARNLMRSKKLQGMVAGTIALSALMDMTARLLSDDEDDDGRSDWDSIPAWDKERNIHLPFAIPGTESKYMKIPAPWVFNVFWRMGQMVSEAAAGQRSWQSLAADSIGLTMSTFNPLGTKPTDSVAQMVSPTALDPFVQIWENKDFAGNPLGPDAFPGAGKRPDSALAWSNMPEGYKYIAKMVNEVTGGTVAESGAIDLRPSTYKVLVDTAMGSAGRFIQQMYNVPEAARGEARTKDVPILRQFASDGTEDPMEAQLYHERLARVMGADKALRMYRGDGPDRDFARAQELMKERRTELSLVKYAKDAEKQLRALRERMRDAQRRGDDKAVEMFKQRMEGVRERFNKAYARRVGN